MKNIYLGIILSLWSIHLIAADAGWINSFDGDSDSYLIKRSNTTIPTTVFTVLQVGDVISVNNAKNYIELYLNGGEKSAKIKRQNSPFIITENAKIPDSADDLWVWLKERFNDWHQLTQLSTITEASNTITMPLLSNELEPVALIAKNRALYLQWDGGQPPYTVEIKKRLESIASINSSMTIVKMGVINFAVDSSYRVKVLDSTGQDFMGGFRTVEFTQMPVYQNLLNSELPIEIQQTLQAIWLTKQNNGKWIFEAYQQVAPLNDYQPAKLLKDALARGQNTQTRRGIRG